MSHGYDFRKMSIDDVRKIGRIKGESPLHRISANGTASVAEAAEKAIASAVVFTPETPVKPQKSCSTEHDYKADFINQLALTKLPLPSHGDEKYGCIFPEHQFHSTRKWRFDFAWPLLKVAVEYQGIFGKKTASHASVSGIARDCEKFTEASLDGWVLILINAKTVENGQALTWTERALMAAMEKRKEGI